MARGPPSSEETYREEHPSAPEFQVLHEKNKTLTLARMISEQTGWTATSPASAKESKGETRRDKGRQGETSKERQGGT